MYLLVSQQKKLFNSFSESPVWWKSSYFPINTNCMKDHPTDAYVQFGFQQFGSFRKRWLFFHFWLVVHHSFKAFKKYIVYELIFFFLFSLTIKYY